MDETQGALPPNTTGTTEQVQKLFAALAEAQGEFSPIQRNREVVIQPREGRSYSFTYADLAEIRGAVTPALAAHGLGWNSATFGTVLRTTLTHAEGATLYTECPAPGMQGDPKQYGGQVSYLRRYHLSMLLGIAADDDIDQDGSETGDTTFTVDRSTSNEPAAPPMRKAQPAGAKIDAGSVAWLERKQKALGLDEDMRAAMLTRLKVPVKPWAELTTDEFATVRAELTTASKPA